jgi:PAS domain S-box-containing protein
VTKRGGSRAAIVVIGVRGRAARRAGALGTHAPRWQTGKPAAVTASVLATVLVDLVDGTARRSPAFEALTGCAWPDGAGRALLDRWLERLEPAAGTDVRAALDTPEPFGRRTLVVRGDDGRERTLACEWALERDANGRACRAHIALARAPEASAADEARGESEQRYRTALQAGRLGSWETDYARGTRHWSPEAMELFGLDLPDGRGRVGGPDDEYRRALHPADRHLADHYRTLADQQDAFEAEYRVVRPDGRVAWLSGRGLVVEREADGRAKRLVSIMADVSEHHEAQERLRLERERLELALGAGHMGAFDLDIRADRLWWSPGMYVLFGVAPQTFVPTREGVLTLMHPDDRRGFVQARNRAIAERLPVAHEFRALWPDGTVHWIAHQGRTEYDDDGHPLRTYGITMDVTERRAQADALLEADRQKDRFIATLAHELRNPLAPIRNAVELLRRVPGADARPAAYGDVIERQVTHMTHLLDDLLDVSRITRGTIRLRRAPTSVGAALERALEVAMPTLRAAGHRLEVELPHEALPIDADLTRIAQVLSNLLINAAKYTPPRGHVAVAALRDGDEAVVHVRDDGLGIAPGLLPRLFEMFGQGADPERAQGGLGIGLWLARALVDLHGGRLAVRSEGPGCGSTFSVHLPLADAPRPRDDARPAHDASGAGAATLSVLIADDKADIADSLADLLRLEGHTVHVAYSGDAAIDAARRFRPQVALLDLGMPGRDGYEVCRTLRAQPWGAGITMVAQTGWGLAEHRQRGREAGFDHHLVKPVDPVELLALLRAAADARVA